MTGSERDTLLVLLGDIEKESGKKQRKWSKINKQRRLKYVRLVFGHDAFKGKLHYNFFPKNTMDYVEATVRVTAQAIQEYAKDEYRVTVLVDGLSRPDERRFATRLRGHGIRTEKVRGVKDEANALIRLADAMCGFCREAVLEEQAEWQSILETAVRDGFLIRVGEK
jgi:hypothetical protein